MSQQKPTQRFYVPPYRKSDGTSISNETKDENRIVHAWEKEEKPSSKPIHAWELPENKSNPVKQNKKKKSKNTKKQDAIQVKVKRLSETSCTVESTSKDDPKQKKKSTESLSNQKKSTELLSNQKKSFTDIVKQEPPKVKYVSAQEFIQGMGEWVDDNEEFDYTKVPKF